MGALLAGLKIAAILLTGIFAAIGLHVDFKDKDNKITPWGRRALIGAVSSTLVAALAQGLESYVQNKDSDTVRARSSVLLNQVLRTTYSLRELNVSADADVPLEHPAFSAYRKRLDTELGRVLHQRDRIGPPLVVGARRVVVWEVTDTTGRKVVGVRASIPRGDAQGDQLFPNEKMEPLAWFALADFGIHIELTRKGHRTPYVIEAKAIDPILEYDSTNAIINIISQRMKDDSWVWEGPLPNSLCDLAGAKMEVSLRYEDIADPKIDSQYRQMVDGGRLKWINLGVAGQSLYFRVPDSSSPEGTQGENILTVASLIPPRYTYVFPDDPAKSPLNCPLLP